MSRCIPRKMPRSISQLTALSKQIKQGKLQDLALDKLRGSPLPATCMHR